MSKSVKQRKAYTQVIMFSLNAFMIKKIEKINAFYKKGKISTYLS